MAYCYHKNTSLLKVFISVVNGGWSNWGSWSACNVAKCGRGTQKRIRYCRLRLKNICLILVLDVYWIRLYVFSNPTPVNNGQSCEGESTQVSDCSVICSPIHGSWSPWGELYFIAKHQTFKNTLIYTRLTNKINLCIKFYVRIFIYLYIQWTGSWSTCSHECSQVSFFAFQSLCNKFKSIYWVKTVYWIIGKEKNLHKSSTEVWGPSLCRTRLSYKELHWRIV